MASVAALLAGLLSVPPSPHPAAMEGGRLLSIDEFHKKMVEERALKEGKVDVTDAIKKDRQNERHLMPFAMDAARIASALPLFRARVFFLLCFPLLGCAVMVVGWGGGSRR